MGGKGECADCASVGIENLSEATTRIDVKAVLEPVVIQNRDHHTRDCCNRIEINLQCPPRQDKGRDTTRVT